jgi:predicted transcriptional regulator
MQDTAMPRNTISFRIDAETGHGLDELASVLGRDRSSLINEAVVAYLELHQWQVEHIRAGLAESEAGEPGRDHDEVFDELETKLKAKLSTR